MVSSSDVLLGSGVGLLIGWTLFSSLKSKTDAESDGGVVDVFRGYPRLCGDAVLYVALQEPVLVFQRLDPTGTHRLLHSLNEMTDIFVRLRVGTVQPALVARVLSARRLAAKELSQLMLQAMRTKPTEASEMEEDIKAIRTSMEGCVHNCMQQSNLNLMEQVA